MKKTYSNPTLEVVRIQTQQMLATSTETFSFGDGTKSGGDAAGRESDFDDED